MKAEILKILKKEKDYVSGQELVKAWEFPGLLYGKPSGSWKNRAM